MGMLEDKAQKGELVGLCIFEHCNLIYQLFADNVGIFLQNNQSKFEDDWAVIQIYEDISSAFLNIGKSIIVPLLNPHPQDWFTEVGCKVMWPWESTIYLGCLIGFNISTVQEMGLLLGKVCKHLSHWANRSLNFFGCSILLKHVIWIMPIYHLMTMSLNTQGFSELREF